MHQTKDQQLQIFIRGRILCSLLSYGTPLFLRYPVTLSALIIKSIMATAMLVKGAFVLYFFAPSTLFMSVRVIRVPILAFIVVTRVFGFCHYLKVFNSIIQPVFINMVNYFIGCKFSVQMLLHNMPVFVLDNIISLCTKITSTFNTACVGLSYYSLKGIPVALKSPQMLHTVAFTVVYGLALINFTDPHALSIFPEAL